VIEIEGKELNYTDVGRKVYYIPPTKKHPEPQSGSISSWNESFVFVKYAKQGRGFFQGSQATSPEHLRWGETHVAKTIRDYQEQKPGPWFPQRTEEVLILIPYKRLYKNVGFEGLWNWRGVAR